MNITATAARVRLRWSNFMITKFFQIFDICCKKCKISTIKNIESLSKAWVRLNTFHSVISLAELANWQVFGSIFHDFKKENHNLKILKKLFLRRKILNLSSADKFCILKNIAMILSEWRMTLCFYFFHFFIFYTK